MPKLRAMGLHSLNREDSSYGLSLALGGTELTLLELSAGFHMLADHGHYQAPQVIRTILDDRDGHGDSRLESTQGEQVIYYQTAHAITDILSDSVARTPMFGSPSLLDLSPTGGGQTGHNE